MHRCTDAHHPRRRAGFQRDRRRHTPRRRAALFYPARPPHRSGRRSSARPSRPQRAESDRPRRAGSLPPTLVAPLRLRPTHRPFRPAASLLFGYPPLLLSCSVTCIALHCPGPPLLSCLLPAGRLSMPTLYERFGVASPFDERRAWVSSPWFSPIALAVLRLTIAVYTTTTLIVVLANDIHGGAGEAYVPRVLCLTTCLTFCQLPVIFYTALLHRALRVLLGRRSTNRHPCSLPAQQNVPAAAVAALSAVPACTALWHHHHLPCVRVSLLATS